MNSFRYGVFMDISICSFIGMILLLVYFVQILTKNRISISPANQITIFFLLVIAIFYSIDIVLYKEWRFRLDDSIILYIQGLKEATHFIDYSNTIKFIGCLLFLSGIIFYIAVKAKKYLQPSTFKKSYLIYSLILCGLLIIPLRGGIGLAPLSPSWAYHSDNLFANHLSLNPLWNFIYTLNQNKGSNNYSNYLQDSEAKITFDSLTNTSDSSSFQFLKQLKPNIILIFLESFTSNFLNRKHKELEITPHLNSWLKKGVYFDNAYASGDRTDKGLPAVLSSYPSQSKTSILKYSNKTDKLESIADQLHLRGYTNYFYYGGDLLFAGMNSYFLANGFNHLIDKESFDPLSYNAKWGVHDHLLFRKILTDLDTLSSPFFLNILTISSHPPYD
ncbi:MAG: sulfatase-like hydrolase/transferase, partial [Saprospiraceae bacterium]|nr:sulfatase-like hydrolase/transferase [Saprospiraceae bacterium]